MFLNREQLGLEIDCPYDKQPVQEDDDDLDDVVKALKPLIEEGLTHLVIPCSECPFCVGKKCIGEWWDYYKDAQRELKAVGIKIEVIQDFRFF